MRNAIEVHENAMQVIKINEMVLEIWKCGMERIRKSVGINKC